jgi:hypothetical protein
LPEQEAANIALQCYEAMAGAVPNWRVVDFLFDSGPFFFQQKAPMPTRAACLLLLSLPVTCGQAGAREPDFRPVVTRSVAANRISETPDYADAFPSETPWLDFGFESRSRYEYRWYDFTTPELVSDGALVTRNLLFFGVKGALDPLRLGVELEDSRRFLSDRIANANVETGFEFLQAFVQLHWEDAVGGQSLNLGFGRMAFDIADRRMVARNRNRNAISSFDGFRLRLGDDLTPWEIDVIATRPVERRIDQFDISNRNVTLAGVAAYWRGWSPRVVLEPWSLWLDQSEEGDARRDLHSFGLHAFGQWGEGGAWDYDLSLAGQTGSSRDQPHRAWAAHVEAGHTWDSSWKPRLAAWLNYASGDSARGDGRSGRFDPLFGATYAFYGFSSYFAWQNMINPAARLSFQPLPKLRCEFFQRAFWLASAADGWVRTPRVDPTGSSGRFVGHETDVRIIWQAHRNFEIDIAYSHFIPGGFTRATGDAPPADFFQIAGSLRF